MTALGLSFSHPLDLRRAGRTPWGFVGSRQRLGGVDMRFGWGRSRMALEVGCDGVGHWGAVGALGIRVLDRRLRLLARYFAPGFHSFFGGASGASGMQNELGGIAVLSGRGWRLYAEAYRRPQRSYFVPVAATYATWGARGHGHCAICRCGGRGRDGGDRAGGTGSSVRRGNTSGAWILITRLGVGALKRSACLSTGG